MIVTFSTNAHGDITFLGSVALDLLRIMGRDETLPSAMYAEDIPNALARLRAAIQTEIENIESDKGDDHQGDDAEVEIGLQQRALPLIQLLEAARDADTPVMWDS